MRERLDRSDGETVDLERLVVRQIGQRSDMAVRRDHQVSGRVRVLVQERDRRVAVVNEERIGRVERACRLVAEHTADLLVRLLDVLETPGRPQGLRHDSVSTTACHETSQRRRLAAWRGYGFKLAGAAIAFLLLGVLGILIFDGSGSESAWVRP